jgi:hypothetical protein
MSSTTQEILHAVPGLGRWLRRVFWVMGGYVVTTGFLVLYVANTGLRSDSGGALAILALSGLASIGWMTTVNFLIRSDFKWALLCLDLVWALGLLLAATAR